MTVPDAKAAVLLENLIAVRDLPMFIFGCKEDEALLTDRRHSWKLNSTVIPPSMVGVCGIESSFRRLTVILRTFHTGGWRLQGICERCKGQFMVSTRALHRTTLVEPLASMRQHEW